jgi:hypothetical protein
MRVDTLAAGELDLGDEAVRPGQDASGVQCGQFQRRRSRVSRW